MSNQQQQYVRTVTVRFRQAVRGSRATTPSDPYTYLIPAGVDLDVGDTVVVPVGRYGHTRRATVTDVGTLDYKYVLAKVIPLSEIA